MKQPTLKEISESEFLPLPDCILDYKDGEKYTRYDVCCQFPAKFLSEEGAQRMRINYYKFIDEDKRVWLRYSEPKKNKHLWEKITPKEYKGENAGSND